MAERGRRRPRMCLASASPGGLGQPSVPTTWDCLRWLDGEGRTRAEARGIRGVKSPPSDPGSAVPRTQIAAVGRRKATRSPLRARPLEFARSARAWRVKAGDHEVAPFGAPLPRSGANSPGPWGISKGQLGRAIRPASAARKREPMPERQKRMLERQIRETMMKTSKALFALCSRCMVRPVILPGWQ